MQAEAGRCGEGHLACPALSPDAGLPQGLGLPARSQAVRPREASAATQILVCYCFYCFAN